MARSKPRPKAPPSETPVRPKRRRSARWFPSTYNKLYPQDEGHDYLIRGIPTRVWTLATNRAEADDVAYRVMIIRLLEYYADHGMPGEE